MGEGARNRNAARRTREAQQVEEMEAVRIVAREVAQAMVKELSVFLRGHEISPSLGQTVGRAQSQTMNGATPAPPPSKEIAETSVHERIGKARDNQSKKYQAWKDALHTLRNTDYLDPNYESVAMIAEGATHDYISAASFFVAQCTGVTFG